MSGLSHTDTAGRGMRASLRSLALVYGGLCYLIFLATFI